jgi:polar amino acid transport system substrate-binding protein
MLLRGIASALLGCLILTGMSTGAFAQRCEPEKVSQKYPEYAGKMVRIAATPTYQPYTYADPADLNKMTGLEIELIEAAMTCAGLKFEYVKGPWTGLLPTLFSGATDVMAGNVVYRADRAERADFIIFYVNGQSFLVQKGNPKNIRKFEDLCGKTSSAATGSASAFEVDKQSKACVQRGQPPIAFQPAVDQEAASRQLANGRIDFQLEGTATAALKMGSDSGKDLEVAFSIATELAAGYAVKKGNETMARIVYDGLQALEADGRLNALMEKYNLGKHLRIPVEIRK